MLVQNINEMKKYLPSIVMKGTPTVFDDALDDAQQSLVSDIIGQDLEAKLELREESDHQLLKLCQRAISIMAFLRSIPEMDLVLTDAGFAVMNNEQMAPASQHRIQALQASLQAKLDESKDKLVTYLLRTSAYADWRGSEEFGRLSDGLILTFAEFKDVAVFNSVTEPAYPKNWSEFLNLNSALNVALMTDAASYISKDYAEEILEKIRDKEHILPIEEKVLKLVKISIAAFAMGDCKIGTEQIIKAKAIMKSNISDFPTYASSPEAAELINEHTDSPIFSVL